MEVKLGRMFIASIGRSGGAGMQDVPKISLIGDSVTVSSIIKVLQELVAYAAT